MCHRIFKFRSASSCRRLSVVRRGGRLGIWIQSCKYFVNINMSYEKQQKRLEELWQEILSEEETEVSAFEVDATSDEYEPETSSEDSSSECSSKKKSKRTTPTQDLILSSEASQSTSIHTTAAQQTVISSSSTIIQNTVEQTIQDVIDAFFFYIEKMNL